jgi:hypothetical protein
VTKALMHREAKWPTTSSPVTPTWSSSGTTRPILGVVADKPDLFCSQPDVEGVQHRTHRRDGAIGFDMLLVVPHERGDPAVGTHADIA